MNTKRPTQPKAPAVVFNKKLERLQGKVLFPEKVAKANEILAKTGLPKLKPLESQSA